MILLPGAVRSAALLSELGTSWPNLSRIVSVASCRLARAKRAMIALLVES